MGQDWSSPIASPQNQNGWWVEGNIDDYYPPSSGPSSSTHAQPPRALEAAERAKNGKEKQKPLLQPGGPETVLKPVDPKPLSPEKPVPVEPLPPLPCRRCHCRAPEDNYMQMACRLMGHLGNHLPTRSFFSFQLLYGLVICKNEIVTAMLVAIFGAACFISCFADSYHINCRIYFRFLACQLSCCECSCSDQRRNTCHMRRFRVRLSDFLHALTSTAVYAIFVLSDPTVIATFYQYVPNEIRQLLQWLRLLMVILSALVFCKFPTHRQGVGFAVVGARPCGSVRMTKSQLGAKNGRSEDGLTMDSSIHSN